MTWTPAGRPRSIDAVRLTGVVVVLAAFAWTVTFHRSAVAAMEGDAGVSPSAYGAVLPAKEVGTAADYEPEELAFRLALPSGAYDVADLPTSTDRDYTVRTSRTVNQAADLNPADDVGPLGSVAPALANDVPEERGRLAPGLYATAFDVEGCGYQLRRVMRTRTEQVVGQEYLGAGRLLVTINEIEPDRFISAPGCGDWVSWTVQPDPLEIADNGDYWIGDLQLGLWESPAGCLWEKVVGFRGASLWDVEGSGRSPEPLVVDEDTLGVRIRGCSEPMTRKNP